MATEYYKFIKVSKGGQEYYYNCPNFFNSSTDCFNFMRADLNRVLLTDIPSQYSAIDCNSVTTTSTTSVPTTTITTTSGSTTSTSTSTTSTTLYPSQTTGRPCDVGFKSVTFVNNANFPYDYTLQQGYIQIELKTSIYSRQYQFRVVSGTNVIKDWTSPVSQNIVAFKLNCANYNIHVRDYNDVACLDEIYNISVPCLILPTSTTSTTSTSTTSSGSTTTSTTSTTSTSTTVPITTTSTTTQFIPAPCAFYYNISDNIYYKDITNSTERLLLSGTVSATDISLYNGNLYLHKPSSNNVQKISLSNLSKTNINLLGTFGNGGLNSATHDSNGNYYLANGNILKFIPSGSNYVYDGNVVELYDNYPTQGDILYIPNINAFAMTSGNGTMAVLIVVKADGSNLILNEIPLGVGVNSYAMFVYNSTLYCTNYGQEKNYMFKIDLDNNTVTRDTTFKLIDYAFGGTQNANCLALNYNNQFSLSNIVYNCVENNVFNLQFDINNGSGVYEYGINGIGYSPINGTHFDFNFNTSVTFIYIKDTSANKVYKFKRDMSVRCQGFVPTTTTSTTINCIPITSLSLNGSTNVFANSIESYSVGSYLGSPIDTYLWTIDGGTIVGTNDQSTVDVIWDLGETIGQVTISVTNCSGTKYYYRTINIS